MASNVERYVRNRRRERERERMRERLEDIEHITPIERERRLDEYMQSIQDLRRGGLSKDYVTRLNALRAQALETVSPEPPRMPTPMSQERERRRSLRDVLRRRGRASTMLTREPLGGGARLS